jgi:hypothetical protein
MRVVLASYLVRGASTTVAMLPPGRGVAARALPLGGRTTPRPGAYGIDLTRSQMRAAG